MVTGSLLCALPLHAPQGVMGVQGQALLEQVVPTLAGTSEGPERGPPQAVPADTASGHRAGVVRQADRAQDVGLDARRAERPTWCCTSLVST